MENWKKHWLIQTVLQWQWHIKFFRSGNNHLVLRNDYYPILFTAAHINTCMHGLHACNITLLQGFIKIKIITTTTEKLVLHQKHPLRRTSLTKHEDHVWASLLIRRACTFVKKKKNCQPKGNLTGITSMWGHEKRGGSQAAWAEKINETLNVCVCECVSKRWYAPDFRRVQWWNYSNH